MTDSDMLQKGDGLRKARKWAEAIVAYGEAIKAEEVPDADICLKLARCCEKLGDHDAACRWLLQVTDSAEAFTPWQSAASLMARVLEQHEPGAKRAAKLAVLGSYTTAQLVPMMRLAALRMGVALELYEADYAQYRQETLNPESGLYAFEPDFVLLAMHHGEVTLPDFSDAPDDDVQSELARWTSLWETLASRCPARVIMHNFALPIETPLGHLSSRLPGSRAAMMHALNARLGESAGAKVSIVDCERLSSLHGKRRWFDDKYWHVAKHAVALDALPMLAKHTAAVLAADLGLSRKVLVLDLDNTLWGGIIGEDGLSGIALGAGPDGEAFVAFQEYILQLKAKGVVLAVCSKNNDADAREPFEQHPDMRIKLDDIAMFVANWKPKSENLPDIAKALNLGLDSFVFVDDNPVEREVIRQMVPEVEVITLPSDPTGYVRALAESLWFETSSFTAEDAKKTEQYRARAEIAQLESASTSLEDFYASLEMKAVIAPFDELHLPRIVQLIGKTNQFNLTTRRHTLPKVQQFMADDNCAHFYLKLRDRFTDHGLVGMVIAFRDGDVLAVDTWLMSCRVIGRTAEDAMLARLCGEAKRLGCAAIRGTYIPTAKNGMVKDIFAKFGFDPEPVPDDAAEGTTAWRYDLAAKDPIESPHIQVESTAGEPAHDAA